MSSYGAQKDLGTLITLAIKSCLGFEHRNRSSASVRLGNAQSNSIFLIADTQTVLQNRSVDNEPVF